jgi:hypothetical protein
MLRSDDVPNLFDLLARGYFPKELPQPFTTENFATYITTAIPTADFDKTISQKPKIRPSRAGRYSLARGGLSRRPLSICHPVAQFLLSKEIVANWAQIQPLISGTKISATHPEDKPSGRAIDGHLPQNARTQQAQQKRLGKRFVLQADVSRFYSSIYTHSIPWAMHSKSTSKANHSTALLGNRIDSLVRLGQDSQTIGIPIGPDTSLVIAEMIMHKCDARLESNIATLQGFRFIDDFELSFATQAEAEHAHHTLEACLADFELALNPKKTVIRELPLPLEAPWVTKLKRAKPRSPAAQQAADLVILFDIAIGLHKDYPGEAVLQFAISLLRYEVIESQNWQLFQRLIMLCSLPEPACFPVALRQIVVRLNAGQTTLIPEIAEIANALIVTHSPLRHSSEVANAAYACLALGLTMNDEAVDAISQCDDPVVALLALDCEERQLTSKPLNKTLWSSHMKAEELYDEFWLLAYEANLKGWLPDIGGIDFVAADQNFGVLKAAGVQFYDANLGVPAAAPPVTSTLSAAPAPGSTAGPSNSPAPATGTTAALPPTEIIVLTDPLVSG